MSRKSSWPSLTSFKWFCNATRQIWSDCSGRLASSNTMKPSLSSSQTSASMKLSSSSISQVVSCSRPRSTSCFNSSNRSKKLSSSSSRSSSFTRRALTSVSVSSFRTVSAKTERLRFWISISVVKAPDLRSFWRINRPTRKNITSKFSLKNTRSGCSKSNSSSSPISRYRQCRMVPRVAILISKKDFFSSSNSSSRRRTTEWCLILVHLLPLRFSWARSRMHRLAGRAISYWGT